MAIPDYMSHNFQTLMDAARDHRRLALVECTDKATGKPVMAICVVNYDDFDNVDLIPIAKMFDTDPFEELNPPI